MARYHIFVFANRFPPRVVYGGITYLLEARLDHTEICLTVTKQSIPPVVLNLASSYYGVNHFHRKLYIDGIWMEPNSPACRFMEFLTRDGLATVSRWQKGK